MTSWLPEIAVAVPSAISSPCGHHEHPVADLVDHVHVVLDEQHRAALVLELLDVLEQALLERRVHAGHRLVEHDQLRIGHQRPGHLEQLALTARQAAGELVAHVVEPEPLEQRRRRGSVMLVLLARATATGTGRPRCRSPRLAGRAEAHVLDDRQPGQALGQLERAHHAEAGDLVRRRRPPTSCPSKRPRPAVGLVEPGEQVEERRLAGAVGADQRGDLVALDLDVVDVDGGEAAEAAPHAVGDEDRVGLGDAGHGARSSPSPASVAGVDGLAQRTSNTCSRRSPKMPCGRKIDEQGERRAGDDVLDDWPKLFWSTSHSGSLSVPRRLLEHVVDELDHEEEDHRADDRSLHPAETAEDDDREGEERQRRGELARSAPTASGRPASSPPIEPITPPRIRLCILNETARSCPARGRRPRPRGCSSAPDPTGCASAPR